MKVHVKRCHIRNGIAGSNRACPVALAIRSTGQLGYIHVGYNTIILESLPYLLPRSVERFIYKFDHGKPVKPFTFILRHAS